MSEPRGAKAGWVAPEGLERERADCLNRRPTGTCEDLRHEERAAKLATGPLDQTLQPVSPSAPP